MSRVTKAQHFITSEYSLRPTELFPLSASRTDAAQRPLPDYLAFEFRECTEDMKHEARHRIRFVRIDVLRDRNESDTQRSQLLYALQALYETPAPTVKLPDQDSIKVPPPGVFDQPIQFGTAGLCSAPTGINVFAYNMPTPPVAIVPQFTELHFAGLISGTDAGVDSGFHLSLYHLLYSKSTVCYIINYMATPTPKKPGRKPEGLGKRGEPQRIRDYPTLLVTIRPSVKAILGDLADKENRPKWKIIEDAIRLYSKTTVTRRHPGSNRAR